MSNKKPDEITPAKPAKRLGAKLPAAKILPARRLLNVEDLSVEVRKVDEIGGLLWMPEGLEEAQKNARLVRALELYEDLDPADGAEGMLAAQMVGTHSAALECLRRAALSGQSFEGRDVNLKHAQKLMTLYTQQLAALNKHRGKGQQKVTVEYVNVEAGGQAIVGSVEATRNEPRLRSAPKALSHDAEVPLVVEPPRELVPRKKR